MSFFTRLWNSLTGNATPADSPRAGASSQPEQKIRTGAERRRFPRARVLSALAGYDVGAEASVNIVEISLGGFSVESAVMFEVGSEHTFLFSTAEGAETMVRCVCRHARGVEVSGPRCIAGFEFLPGQESSLQIIVQVYERLRRRHHGT